MRTSEESKEDAALRENVPESERYIKTALYVYPALRAVAAEIGEHVERKAYLSYDDKGSCFDLAAYLLGQIEAKNKLEELAETIKGAVEKLTENEKFLLHVRYFGGKNKQAASCSDEELHKICGSRRSYYRKQAKLLKKMGEAFKRRGLSEENFYEEYGEIGLIARADRAIAAGKRGVQGAREEALIARLK